LLHFVLFILIVVAGTGGELCVSRAIKVVGEPPSLHPADVANVILSALRVPGMWLGVGMMTVAFFAAGSLVHIRSEFRCSRNRTELRRGCFRRSCLSA
jgi:hypothetical protein